MVPSLQDGFGQSGTYSRVGVGDEDRGEYSHHDGSLSVTKGAALTTSTFGSANAGNMSLMPAIHVSFDGEPDPLLQWNHSRAEWDLKPQGRGDIRITTGSLSITDGAELTTEPLDRVRAYFCRY